MVRKKPTDKKLNALKKYSALNRQPQRVRDKLFDQDDFFDAWDLVQVKTVWPRSILKITCLSSKYIVGTEKNVTYVTF
jgi:hypothetical protein